MTRAGHSLTEIAVVVLILGVLAFVGVPRLRFDAVERATANAVARKLATDLRRARAEALLHAAQNPVGVAVVMTGSGRYSGYQIVNLLDSSVLDTHTIAAGVSCTGAGRLEFGPLGNLRDGSGTTIQVTAHGRTCRITLVSATGMVKCQ
jgi:Tfp pilus assembly protein FimT